MSAADVRADLIGWDRLRHSGLLLDPTRLRRIAEHAPPPLPFFHERELRRLLTGVLDSGANVPEFVGFVLEHICGFTGGYGTWRRGSDVGAEWGRRLVTGETVKPRQLWRGDRGAILPVFIDSEHKLGIGRGLVAASRALQWLRAGGERLAVLTNGRQWRLVFAGLDFDAWCQWDADLWLEEGALSPQVHALRTLLRPDLWLPPAKDVPAPLLQAILDSRKGQADLSAVLGERVREAVELLVQGHGDALKDRCADVDRADIYRAAVRIVMRIVVVLFAESRESLLPRDNALYHGAYGLSGLLEELEKVTARGGNRLARSWSAWPRVLSLFRLVHQGSHHPVLPVPEYGGELFAPGDRDSGDGLVRGLDVFENACFDAELLSDRDVHSMLERITRTRVKIRQGRAGAWVQMPVDFSDLSSEYIGILYEGLLDFELKTAPAGDPIIFLAVGNQPALPLSRLEEMDDNALANLLERMKDTSKSPEEEHAEEDDVGADADASEQEEDDEDAATDDDVEAAASGEDGEVESDDRHKTRTRAETWGLRAAEVGKLVRRPKGTMTPEKRLAYEDAIARKARQLVTRVVLPGEWYLVRWGGTRKGSGTFYTRPGLAVPTVHRTLRPLVYDPPLGTAGAPNTDAPATSWTPKPPEEILALKVCDPACGSGTFPVAALRFLTEALYASLHHHQRISADGDQAVVRLLSPNGGSPRASPEHLRDELLPCRPGDDSFEPRLKAILRRHVVERCIYGVDLDPLAVELCRLALWIETMDRTLPFSFLRHKIKPGNSLVGAWFDTFQHYPVMAWKNREGGDKNHSNGVHYQKEERTKAIKAFVKDHLTPDLRLFLKGRTLFSEDLQEQAAHVHASALATLSRLHDLPVHDAAERARVYRDEVEGSTVYRGLKSAMDLWCACWFWPADALDRAPLATTLADPSEETRAIVERVANRKRFFHWELEFPDVFRAAGAGFDAVLGNPPWDIAKPSSMEFFSNIDPLYRSYGKQEALGSQSEYFADPDVEHAWLDYSADFRAQSNFVSYAASAFGDSAGAESAQDRFAIWRGGKNAAAHDEWRACRAKGRGFADPAHSFRHQGSADLNLYKLFLEQAYSLLRTGGRLGFVVPSGLYSDHGTGGLRRLFLDRCRWEWLFGFENRDGIFDIHRSFKFNPVVIEKGGQTEAIRTAFMRRKLEDWEVAEALATPYSRPQVERFSPRSKAILEIQSRRDLDILEKIYSNSVLLGDDSPDGWGITYATEFHMTNDSELFPPRPKWEADGYRPDEYSRWLKGDWRPIAELWSELRIDHSRVVPIDPACERRLSESDVQRTEWTIRCAQPLYDRLPIPRADIPAGIILLRDADAWVREDKIEDVALPLYEGRMIGQFDFSHKGWVSGKGRTAVWREIPWQAKQIEPQYLMSTGVFRTESLDRFGREPGAGRTAFMDVTSATNTRTVIASCVPAFPCGNKVPVLSSRDSLSLTALLSSYALDFQGRRRLTGLSLNYFILSEFALPPFQQTTSVLKNLTLRLGGTGVVCADLWMAVGPEVGVAVSRASWAVSEHERLRLRCGLDAVCLALAGLDIDDVIVVLTEDLLHEALSSSLMNPKGFWRVDKDKEPELRQTVLTLVAFADLGVKIRACGGDREQGIGAFLSQNDGEGWMLPETLRLADYGLGHDERAKLAQPVASRLGPRFYDWQLAQSAEVSCRECHMHARNLLGEARYHQLLADIEAARHTERSRPSTPVSTAPAKRGSESTLFD